MPLNGPGITCPQCRKRFPVALVTALNNKTLECPHCGTHVHVVPGDNPLPPGIFDLREQSKREDDSGAG